MLHPLPTRGIPQEDMAILTDDILPVDEDTGAVTDTFQRTADKTGIGINVGDLKSISYSGIGNIHLFQSADINL